jgi:hypothetical protein
MNRRQVLFRASHTPQHLGDGAIPAIEFGKLTDGERPLALAGGTEAIHDKAKSHQIAELAGHDGCPLTYPGCVRCGHSE